MIMPRKRISAGSDPVIIPNKGINRIFITLYGIFVTLYGSFITLYGIFVTLYGIFITLYGIITGSLSAKVSRARYS